MSSTRVYDAERAVFGRKHRAAGMAMSEARALINHYIPGLVVERSRSATYGSSYWSAEENNGVARIRLGPQAGLCVVLHELAHALADIDGDTAGHGVVFMRHYLELIEREMSPWWARRLRAELRRQWPRGWKAACR